MRIAVFGAAGNVGRRIVAEALARGHEVTAVVRDAARLEEVNAAARGRTGDAANVDDVAALGRGHDVVVGATRPPAGRERDLVTAARALLAGVAQTDARLVLVGGAATLAVPGGAGTKVMDDPRFLEPAYRAIALACAAQLEACRAEGSADWTYLSPPALLEPGTRTGHYRLGGDELLLDAAGQSVISMEDFAVAVLDEVERPAHRRARFTVGY
ncbi:NAD(P)H-binding protein [Pendulispora rubella]|uniref:NAD(P)H-binding protein n=1 Tax=Pendulispora rubella TaxID=2741070 RepID=A0ABZ2KQ92_9BACT